MGAKQSNQYSAENLKNFATEYAFEKSIDDSRFGCAQIYKNKVSGQKAVVTTRVFASAEELETFTKEVQSRIEDFSHPNLLTIFGYQETAMKNLCSAVNKFSLYFEYLKRDLAAEIKARSKTGEFFSEEEAWYLVNSLLCAVDYLKSKGIHHGAIQPSHILINEEGNIKLFDNEFLSNQTVFCNDNGFLAPEQLNAVDGQEVDQHQADLYCAGLTLLEILSLRDVATLVIDREEKKINGQGIAELVFQAKRRYSSPIVDLALRLLSEQPNNRIGLQNAFDSIRTSVHVKVLPTQVVSTVEAQSKLVESICLVKQETQEVNCEEIIKKLSLEKIEKTDE